MRIAVFVHAFPNISETFVLNQITGLIDQGHDIKIFATSGNLQGGQHELIAQYGLIERTHYIALEKHKLKRIVQFLKKAPTSLVSHPLEILNSINIFRYGIRAFRIKSILECIHWLTVENRSFDIVYCHFGPNGLKAEALINKGYISGKLITVFHAYDLSTFPKNKSKPVYSRLFRNGSLFLSITRYAREKLIRLGCPENLIRIHHMGIDHRLFKFRTHTRKNNEPFHIILIGRMVEKKGFKYALQAIANAHALGYNLNAIIIGDGVLRKNLESLSYELNINEIVQFTGWQTQENIAQQLEQAHVMVVPSVTAENSDEEGLPVVLMEALATGLPVITTHHAGIPELIEDGVTGLLVKERDSEALARKLVHLIENPHLGEELATNGQLKVANEFDIDQLNNTLEKIFHTILEASR